MNKIKVSENNEGTSAPFWIIIDPKQNFSTKKEASHNIASMISGIFFSRESAQEWLDRTRYNYGKNAVVYCHSGHYSKEWVQACKNGDESK